MIDCGSMCLNCDYPIHFDTYQGCSHACKYCFVKFNRDISKIKPIDTTESLRNFIEGKRTLRVNWCDWDIPLHWGGSSDPFQECELIHHKSLDVLKIFNETQYPFIVSTKNPMMLLEEPYYSLMQSCNCVLQVSMACSKYDKLETGCPTFEQRLQAVSKLSKVLKRVTIRMRPYFIDCHKQIIEAIPKIAEAGAYSITVATYVSKKKIRGMTKYGKCYMFDNDTLFPKYSEIKEVCHKHGLKFFCSEEGLEWLGDDLNCCGCGDLEGFRGNTYNASHIAHDEEPPQPTDAMLQTDTWYPFKCMKQSSAWAKHCRDRSFKDLIDENTENMIYFMQQQKEYFESEG